MNKIKISDWFRAAGIRALKSMAQTSLAIISIDCTFSEVNWLETISAAAVAGIYSLLTSIAGLPELKQ